MGTGPGGVATRLAQRSGRRVLAIDANPAMIEVARRRCRRAKGVELLVADAREFDGVEADVWLFSSVLHELAHAGLESVSQALELAAKCLRPGGRLIVRDFVKPSDGARRVVLEHARRDIREGRSFTDFASAARFPVRYGEKSAAAESIAYETDIGGAYEFVLRKDWGATWESELAHPYGFWTVGQCLEMLTQVGLRCLRVAALPNPWVMRHRVRGRVRIKDARTGGELRVFPAQQLLVVAELSTGSP